MKKVLITGIRGFTGKYLATELAAHGWDIWGAGAHEAPEEVQYRCTNLLDVESLGQMCNQIKPDAVIHLAAISFVGHGDPNAFYKVNLIGTRNLLSALAKCSKRPECVLIASSANVYGNNPNDDLLNEETMPNPTNDYAVSKLAMEHMARLWIDQLPLIITRPFNYTGLGQAESFLLPKVVGHFQRKEKIIELGNLDVWRDFSDVRTVAHAYRRLLEVKPLGETINICSGQLHSLREIVSMAGEISGHSMQVVVNPSLVRPNEVRSLCGDATKLKKLIGKWQPPKLEDTLRWMLTGAMG